MSERNYPARILDFGATTVVAGATVTLSTLARAASERPCSPDFFITNNVAGAAWSYDNPLLILAGGASFWYERTANANEYTLRVENNDAADRTYNWTARVIMPGP